METIWSIGITWNIFLQNLGTWLKAPMEAFSFLGTEYFFLLLMLALYWCVDAGLGLRVGIILLLSTSVNDALFPYILRYVRYFMVGAWMSAGTPSIFGRLHLAEKAT